MGIASQEEVWETPARNVEPGEISAHIIEMQMHRIPFQFKTRSIGLIDSELNESDLRFGNFHGQAHTSVANISKEDFAFHACLSLSGADPRSGQS